MSTEPARTLPSRALPPVLSTVCGGAFALVLWAMGYYALVDPIPGKAGSLLFFGAVMGMLFGIVGPLSLVTYFGNRFAPRFRLLYVAAGYVLIVSFVGVLAALGVPQALDIDSAEKVVAALDAVFGGTLGAIAGDKLALAYRE